MNKGIEERESYKADLSSNFSQIDLLIKMLDEQSQEEHLYEPTEYCSFAIVALHSIESQNQMV